MGDTRGNPGLHRFAVFTAISTFCLIVAGALVTSNDAGLSVPDWPLSYGSLFPPMVGNIRYEHTHRLIAGFVLVLLAGLAIWLRRAEPRAWVRWLGYSALAAGVGQAILGGITVLFFLPTLVSVGHACLAQVIFSATVMLAIVTGRKWRNLPPAALDPNSPPLSQLAALTAGAVFLQLMMGAAFRHNGFGILPHLVGAAIVTALVMWTLYRVISRHSGELGLMRPAGLLGVLLMVQLLLGGASYLVLEATRDAPQPLPPMVYTTVAHVAGGALTLATSVWLLFAARRLLHTAENRREAREGTVSIST